jgi:hypothetical protein
MPVDIRNLKKPFWSFESNFQEQTPAGVSASAFETDDTVGISPEISQLSAFDIKKFDGILYIRDDSIIQYK